MIPFHHLLLGLSGADIISSTALLFTTLPARNYYGIISWNAMLGNKISCRVQGFFIFFGSIAAPLYNCSLCIYYLIIVTYRRGRNADEYVEGKIEFFLHAVPIVVPLIGATVILSLDAFHPNITYCFIEADPMSKNLEDFVLFAVFSAGPYIILPLAILIAMLLVMHRTVLALEEKLRQASSDIAGITSH